MKRRCDLCGRTRSGKFWPFEDGTMLCEECYLSKADSWQAEIDRGKARWHLNNSMIIISLVAVILCIAHLFNFYFLGGYGLDGYSRLGFDREGYDRDGFNNNGFDREGFDSEGYDKFGFDRQGYNRQGLDKYGFYETGFDAEGYDADGFDSSGLDAGGFDREGYNAEGFDREGYSREGISRAGFPRNYSTLEELSGIAVEYRKTHSYSLLDLFVCTDMSIDVWNIIETRGIAALICAGNIDEAPRNHSNYEDIIFSMDHAWVLAEPSPGSSIAVETTGGYLVYPKGRAIAGGVENDLYYSGACFPSPKEFKDFLDLRNRYFDSCRQYSQFAQFWNDNYAGRGASPESTKYKGRLEAKQEECRQFTSELKKALVS